MILHLELPIADKPVSALDVSVGAQILELLNRLRREFSLTLISISHDLPVVAQLATRIAVMKGGRFVEIGATEQLLETSQHDYTRALLAVVPYPRINRQQPLAPNVLQFPADGRSFKAG